MRTTNYTDGRKGEHNDLYDAMSAIITEYPDAVFYDESGCEVVKGDGDVARWLQVWKSEDEHTDDAIYGARVIAEII